MPFAYRFDARRRLVVITYSEPCTAADGAAVLHVVAQEPWFPEVSGVLADVRGIGFTPTLEDVRLFATVLSNPLTYGRRPVAVVVSGALHYGVGRQLALLAESFGGRVGVFERLEEADGWLLTLGITGAEPSP